MKNLNTINNKSNENTNVTEQDPSILLAEFFNGTVINAETEYAYDS